MTEAFRSALNVLLVEDDKGLAGFVREGLEDESCIVKVCYDGGSGLRQAEIHSFDIILLDAGMKSITIEIPQSDDRVFSVAIDKSIGGQPNQASQLVMNRQTGQVEAMKQFSDNNAGRKLRAWARFLHTGELF